VGRCVARNWVLALNGDLGCVYMVVEGDTFCRLVQLIIDISVVLVVSSVCLSSPTVGILRMIENGRVSDCELSQRLTKLD
jgi:hypothetical protein